METGFDLTGIAVVACAATLCGTLMRRFGQPAIAGYILAGILLGPSGIGLITDRTQVGFLAELGVLMLLYFVGMELSLRNFRRGWRIAVFTTVTQTVVSVVVLLAVTRFFDWPASHAVFFGFVLALSSTAVAIRMLEDVGELRTRVGRITVGILVAQDLAVAPMLLIVGALAGEGFQVAVIFKIIASIVFLTAATVYLSKRRRINLPFASTMVGGMDLTPVAALTWCFACAAVSGLLGLTPAFGAFIAGLIVNSSAQRQIVRESAHPIQSVLLMVFFLSIGLLIDLAFLWENLGLVLVLWFLVSVFKTALNTGILRFLGEPWRRAFLSSLILAQLGEFSFVLGAAAIDRGVIDSDIYKLVVAVTVLSLMTGPLWLASARRLHHRAAIRTEHLGDLLRLIYFKEWRFTRRASINLAAQTVAAAKYTRNLRHRDKAVEPPPESVLEKSEDATLLIEHQPDTASTERKPPKETEGDAKQDA
ncbi:MAG: cation:proton antiporter [Alphaproteobacteria bacterium]|nr:cation:proton antiporter [Alphaproteobacteria bacterium]